MKYESESEELEASNSASMMTKEKAPWPKVNRPIDETRSTDPIINSFDVSVRKEWQLFTEKESSKQT